jgi:hypothetical protein
MEFTKELENRLAELLDDFAGGEVSFNSDEDINGSGLVVRVMGPEDAMVEIRISIEDVTEALTGEPVVEAMDWRESKPCPICKGKALHHPDCEALHNPDLAV